MIKNYYIEIDEVIKQLEYQDCFIEDMTVLDNNNYLIGINNKNILQKLIGKNNIILLTRSNGTYRLGYRYIPSNQKITVLGQVSNKKIVRMSNVFIEKGDVPLERMVEKIDTSFDYRISAILFITFLLGIKLEYFS